MNEEVEQLKAFLEQKQQEELIYKNKIQALNPIPNYSDIEKVMISMYMLLFVANLHTEEGTDIVTNGSDEDDIVFGEELRTYDLMISTKSLFQNPADLLRESHNLHIPNMHVDDVSYRVIGAYELHLICQYFGIGDETSILNEMMQIGFTEYHENDKLYYIIRNPVYIRWVREHNGFIDVYPDDD